MSVERIALRLVGVGPLIMHSSRLADPLDPLTNNWLRSRQKPCGRKRITNASHSWNGSGAYGSLTGALAFRHIA